MAGVYSNQDRLLSDILLPAASEGAKWYRSFPWYDEVFCCLNDEVIKIAVGGKKEHVIDISEVGWIFVYWRGLMLTWAWKPGETTEHEALLLDAVFKSERNPVKLSFEMDRIRNELLDRLM